MKYRVGRWKEDIKDGQFFEAFYYTEEQGNTAIGGGGYG